MIDRAVLVLEDGSSFQGEAFGALVDAEGEVVFCTGMTGYQEIATDPSYRGQMVVLTHPLIGNYGVTRGDEESARPWISALIVRSYYPDPSNFRSEGTLDDYLRAAGVPAITGVDTRALTRRLRSSGTMRAVLARFSGEPDLVELAARARSVTQLSEKDLVNGASTDATYPFTLESPVIAAPPPLANARGRRIVAVDCGIKVNILRSLANRGFEVVVVPHTASAADILALAPSGVLIGNGPGDPSTLPGEVAMVRGLLDANLPMMCICLGHQLLGQAIGGTTSRLKFGHHGGNHPVKDLTTNSVHITSQNHEFQLDRDSIPPDSGFFVSHVNLNDGSVEGLAHPTRPVFSVQYHPEGSPGPQDNQYLFDRFVAIVDGSLERGSAGGKVGQGASPEWS